VQSESTAAALPILTHITTKYIFCAEVTSVQAEMVDAASEVENVQHCLFTDT
jgi:hypothetical protein